MRSISASLAAAALCALTLGTTEAQDFRPGKGKQPETLSEAAAKAVRVRLIAENDALVPGQESLIALTFDIAPGWHLYWHNPGDSGLPISWELDPPAGLAVGEALWPAPDRTISPGDILDYTYSERVTILLPVTLAADHPAGTNLRLGAKVSWLVCREGCVPGGAEVDLTIPVAPRSARGPEADRLEETRKRLPQTPGAFERAGGRLAWSGQTLLVSSPRADSLEYLPYTSEAASIRNPIRDGAAAGSQLEIEYKLAEDLKQPIRALIRVNRAGQEWYYLVEVPPPTR